MSDNENEVYIVAKKKDDDSTPGIDEVYDGRVFFCREDADEALRDFQPFQRAEYDVFTADLVIGGVDEAVEFVMPDVTSNKVNSEDADAFASLDDDDDDL